MLAWSPVSLLRLVSLAWDAASSVPAVTVFTLISVFRGCAALARAGVGFVAGFPVTGVFATLLAGAIFLASPLGAGRFAVIAFAGGVLPVGCFAVRTTGILGLPLACPRRGLGDTAAPFIALNLSWVRWMVWVSIQAASVREHPAMRAGLYWGGCRQSFQDWSNGFR